MDFAKNKKLVLGVLAGLLILNIFAWIEVYDLSRAKFLEVIFFDVGQGDAVLIKSAEGHFILIDGGPDSGILEKLAEEIPSWSKEIDLIVLTHPHADHFGGLIDVLKKYNVENILWGGVVENSASFRIWKNSALESGAEMIIARVDKRVRGKNFFIDVLYPFVNLEGIEFKDANLSSLVLRLVFKDNAFLFIGDAYKSMEKELIKKEELCREDSSHICRAMVLGSDILKVGHHGSKTSTSEEFVMAVSPETAVISAGKNNRHGHPHQETLDVLEKYDITILRTDMHGDIKIISDGTNINYEVSNF